MVIHFQQVHGSCCKNLMSFYSITWLSPTFSSQYLNDYFDEVLMSHEYVASIYVIIQFPPHTCTDVRCGGRNLMIIVAGLQMFSPKYLNDSHTDAKLTSLRGQTMCCLSLHCPVGGSSYTFAWVKQGNLMCCLTSEVCKTLAKSYQLSD